MHISGRGTNSTAGTLTQGLLLEDEEQGVNQFDVFDIVVDHVVRDEALKGQVGAVKSIAGKRTGVKAEVLQMDQ